MSTTKAHIQPPPAGQRVLLEGIDWPTYTRLLRIFAERPSVRLTYDRRRLEIMSPLPEHESDADMLGRMVVVLTEELDLPLKAGRSATFRKHRKQRGLEPDNSYWILNEPKVRGKRKINLKVDPAPDLGIEVDCTSSSLTRPIRFRAPAISLPARPTPTAPRRTCCSNRHSNVRQLCGRCA